jgi:uncharacterized membrane protein YciS (DUF1049 family)
MKFGFGLIFGLLIYSILTTMDYLKVAKENSQLKDKIERLEHYDEEVRDTVVVEKIVYLPR